MEYDINTTDDKVTIVQTGCDGCDNSNVRISESDIAYERNRHGTWVRHDCGPGV